MYARDLKTYQKVKTLEGEEVDIIKWDGHVFVNHYSRVTAADNAASNGVVHIIDTVLLPPSTPPSPSPTPSPSPSPTPAPATKNIVQLAQSVKDLSTLVTAVIAANLTAALEAKGPFTVFAPTNEAFAKLPAAYLKRLLDPANIKELQAILEYHVVAGAAVYSKDLHYFNRVKTLDQGEEVYIVKEHGAVIVNYKSHVTAADNAATNGVVHIIDEVLIPYH